MQPLLRPRWQPCRYRRRPIPYKRRVRRRHAVSLGRAVAPAIMTAAMTAGGKRFHAQTARSAHTHVDTHAAGNHATHSHARRARRTLTRALPHPYFWQMRPPRLPARCPATRHDGDSVRVGGFRRSEWRMAGERFARGGICPPKLLVLRCFVTKCRCNYDVYFCVTAIDFGRPGYTGAGYVAGVAVRCVIR